MNRYGPFHSVEAQNEPSNLSQAMEIAGGFSVIGAVGAGTVAVFGEIAEILPVVDEFPGGTVGKFAGGLAVTAVALISGSKLA